MLFIIKMTEVVKAPTAHADPETSRSVIFVDRGRHSASLANADSGHSRSVTYSIANKYVFVNVSILAFAYSLFSYIILEDDALYFVVLFFGDFTIVELRL